MVGFTKNGCGACSGFWQFFRPPHSRFFKKECDQHDEAYNTGGNWIDRKIADLKLLNAMSKTVRIYFQNRKPISRIWFLFLCWCYYAGVRIFGKSNFQNN